MDRENSPKLENIHRLEKLYKYLNYEVSSSLLYLASWFIPMFIPLLILAAVIFTPFMLYVLYIQNKKGWITAFVVLVILPVVIVSIYAPLLAMIALAPFYFFCFVLRIEVKGWITEMRARNDLALQKIKKVKDENDFEDWMVMK